MQSSRERQFFFPSSLSGFRWQAGLSNWQAGWSGDKKGWCCSHQQIACPGYKYHGANAEKHVVVTWKGISIASPSFFLLMFSWEPKTCFFFYHGFQCGFAEPMIFL